MSRRTTPYTESGVRRLNCFRCGGKADSQWQVCADLRTFRPLCVACDIALNALVLKWMGDPQWAKKIAHYKKTKI